MPRFSVGAEFILTCESADEARRVVGNFIDAFPHEVGHECEDPDVILQESEAMDE